MFVASDIVQITGGDDQTVDMTDLLTPPKA